MRCQALERSLRLVQALQRSPRTIASLERELDVCTRTIRRDLDVISVVGFPVTSNASDYGSGRVFYIHPADAHCPVCSRRQERLRA